MNSKTAFRLGEVLKIPCPNLMEDCDSLIRTHNLRWSWPRRRLLHSDAVSKQAIALLEQQLTDSNETIRNTALVSLCWMEDDRSLREILLRQIPLATDAPTIQSIDNVLSDTYRDDQEKMQVLKHAKESYPVGVVTANGRTSAQLTSLHTFGPPVRFGLP